MWSTKKGIGKFLGIIILLLLITSTSLSGEETDKESKEESRSKSNFVLIIKDNLISLDAKDASLAEVVKEIGGRMKIDMVTKIPKEKKIPIKFDKLPPEAAMERLRKYADIVYIKDSEGEKARITKMLVFPKKEGKELSKPIKEEESVEPESGKGEETAKEAPQPEPFKFEFDPSEFEEE